MAEKKSGFIADEIRVTSPYLKAKDENEKPPSETSQSAEDRWRRVMYARRVLSHDFDWGKATQLLGFDPLHWSKIRQELLMIANAIREGKL